VESGSSLARVPEGEIEGAPKPVNRRLKIVAAQKPDPDRARQIKKRSQTVALRLFAASYYSDSVSRGVTARSFGAMFSNPKCRISTLYTSVIPPTTTHY
jgi:hypothetical protein